MRILFLLVIIVFFSCKKEKESPYPQISIEKPSDGSHVSAGDTVNVLATIISEDDLTSVTINVLDLDMTGALPAIVLKPAGKSALLNEQLFIPQSIIAGEYYIQVVASTAAKQTRKYVKVNVSSSAGKNKTYFVITGNQYTTYLHRFDTTYITRQDQTFQGKYYTSSIFGQDSHLGISIENSDLRSIQISNNTIAWELPKMSSQSPTYKGVYGFGGNLYVAHVSDGFVKSYDVDKVPKFTSYMALSHTPEDVFVSGDFVFVDEAPVVSSDNRRFSVKYIASGAGKQETTSSIDVVSMLPENNDEIFVFGNSGNQGKMELYRISSNTFNAVRSFTGTAIVKAERINNDDLLILTSQEIFNYRTSTNSLVPFLNIPATNIEFDSERNELFVMTGNELRIYNYTTKQIKRTITLNATVLDLKIVAL